MYINLSIFQINNILVGVSILIILTATARPGPFEPYLRGDIRVLDGVLEM